MVQVRPFVPNRWGNIDNKQQAIKTNWVFLSLSACLLLYTEETGFLSYTHLSRYTPPPWLMSEASSHFSRMRLQLTRPELQHRETQNFFSANAYNNDTAYKNNEGGCLGRPIKLVCVTRPTSAKDFHSTLSRLAQGSCKASRGEIWTRWDTEALLGRKYPQSRILKIKGKCWYSKLWSSNDSWF